MKIMTFVLMHPVALLIYRLLIGLTFVYASYDKLHAPADFGQSIYNYQLLPVILVNSMAIVLPWLEFFCGLGLMIGILTRANAFIVVILLLVFSIAIASSILRGIDLDCGCFNKSIEAKENVLSLLFPSQKAGWPLLIRDLCMAILALTIIVGKSTTLELEILITSRFH